MTVALRDLPDLLRQAKDAVHNDPELAEQLAQTCAHSAGEASAMGLRGKALYVLAQVIAERGELHRAADLIAEARVCLRTAGEAVEALRTGLGEINVLDDLGRHAQALLVARDMLSAARELSSDSAGPNEELLLIVAHTIRNMGTTYGQLGQHDQALESFADAQGKYEVLGEMWDVASCQANRGVELLDLGRPRQALEVLNQASVLFAESEDVLFAAQCEGDRARALSELGHTTAALTLLERARVTLEGLGARAEATRLQLTLAQTYLSLGLGRQSCDAAAQVVEVCRELGMTSDLVAAQYLQGLAHGALGEVDEALAQFDAANKLAQSIDDSQHHARLRLARAEALTPRVGVAQTRAELAHTIEELGAGGWSIPQAHAYLLLADLADDNDSMHAHLEHAEQIRRGEDLPELTYQVELRWARLCRRRDDVAQARLHYLAALRALDQSTGGLTDHALLTTSRAQRPAAHSELVGLLLKRNHEGDHEEACALADASKSRTMLDVLGGNAHVGPDPREPDSESALTSVYARLSSAYLNHDCAPDSRAKALALNRIEELQHEVTAMRLRALQTHATVATTPVLSELVLAGSCGESSAPVISYYVVDTDLIMFVRVDGILTVRTVAGGQPLIHAELDALDQQWRRVATLISLNVEPHETLMMAANTHLAALFDLVIAPVQDLIEASTTAVHIVGHGPMGAVPFQALFDGREYLMCRWAITMAPTVGMMAAEPEVDCGTPATVVAVADDDAPEPAVEARAVAAYLPQAQVLLGQEASADQFMAFAIRSGVVHIACHGRHADDSPLFARLKLADRWLTALEIVRLDMRGAFVTLSTCVGGKRGHDVEALGLAWAFLAAGARGVVASMWNVHDEAARVLMTEFYRQLCLGLGPARALQAAQRHTAVLFPHPFSWAPFTYFNGALDPVQRISTP